MYCKECGAEIEDGKFCKECGAKIEILNEKINTPITEVQKNEENQLEDPTKYENISSLGFAGTLIFLPLAIIIGIYFLTRPEKDAKTRGKAILGLGFFLWTLYAIVYFKS